MDGKACWWGLNPKSSSDIQAAVRCLDGYIEFINRSIKVCGYDPNQRVGIGHKLGEFDVNPLDGLPEQIFGLSGRYPLEFHTHDGELPHTRSDYFELTVKYVVGFKGDNPRAKVNIVSSGHEGIRSFSVHSPLLTGKFPDDLAEIRNCCMEIKNALFGVCSPYALDMVYE
jgi:hypothetical protein